MAFKEFIETASDGIELVCYKNIPKKPKAALLILHGSIEHGQRYFDLGEYLVKNDIAVYTFDQRGHGQTAVNDDDVAYFSDQPKGWFQSVADIKQIVDMVKEENPNVPLTIFGHSMGSFLLRTFIAMHPDAQGKAIASGTADTAKALTAFGRLLCWVIAGTKGRKYRSEMVHGLVYGALNSRVKNPRTSYDFITTDEKIVDQYIADPRCGNLVTVEYAQEMLRGIAFNSKKSTYEMVNKALPLFIVSGENDPVAGVKRADLNRVINGYKKANLKKLEVKIYPNMRHEIVNEIERQIVYDDIKNYILK